MEQASTELKLLRSTDLFRRDLKTFLFHSVYGQQDSVMRPWSSSRGAIQVPQLQLQLQLQGALVLAKSKRLGLGDHNIIRTL